MQWLKYALRKHLMRFDPRVSIHMSFDDPNLEATINSFISSAIISGLDIAGFVSEDPRTPFKAVEIARNNNVDLYILPGQIYKTQDGFNIIIYKKPDKYIEGLTLEQILSDANKNNYLTLVYDFGKQKASTLFKLGEDGIRPTFVEIFNGKSYGYLFVATNTYEVVSSGAEKSSELEISKIYSHVPRKDMEEFGVIPAGQGRDYIPGYLAPKITQEIQ
jgi:hypothetical protein